MKTLKLTIPLQYTNGVNAVATTGILGFEVGRIKYSYRGIESGTVASDTFVLVIDPKRKAIFGFTYPEQQ